MENFKPHLRGNVIWESIYSIETYPESDNRQFDVILSRLNKSFPEARVCYAKHDHDVKDDGTPVKTHFEILFKFPRSKSINVVAEKLEVPVSWIEWKRDWILSVRYLIHADQPEKFQYDPAIVHCSDYRDYSFLEMEHIDKESDHIAMLFDFKDSHVTCTMKDLQDFALQNGLWATFRRNYSILKDR